MLCPVFFFYDLRKSFLFVKNVSTSGLPARTLTCRRALAPNLVVLTIFCLHFPPHLFSMRAAFLTAGFSCFSVGLTSPPRPKADFFLSFPSPRCFCLPTSLFFSCLFFVSTPLEFPLCSLPPRCGVRSTCVFPSPRRHPAQLACPTASPRSLSSSGLEGVNFMLPSIFYFYTAPCVPANLIDRCYPCV